MSLTEQFKPFTEADFAAAFQKEVKNGDFRELLTWKTYEGIDVSPFYHHTDKKKNILAYGNDWEINQEIQISDVKTANKEALQVLNNGVSSLTFIGKIDSKEQLSALLNEIGIQYIELNFKNAGSQILSFLNAYCEEKKIDKNALRGCFYVEITEVKPSINNFPSMQLMAINGVKFQETGATITQQLAFCISEGKEAIDHFISAGFTAAVAIQNIRFTVAIGSNFFLEMAKISALRVLWQNIVQEYIQASVPLHIHAETSRVWMAKEDVNNNLIRATFQSMSAVLGGVDSMYVHPYNFENTSARISTNVQLVIKEEGFLDKVANPADGAFYVSEITNELVLRAWKLFQETEKKGGFTTAMNSEFIQKEIFESAKILKDDIASGKIKVIGVNKHRVDKSEKKFSELNYTKELVAINLFD